MVRAAFRAGPVLTTGEEVSPANTKHAVGAPANTQLRVKMLSQPGL